MRTLYVISGVLLITLSGIVHAEKIEAIDNVSLTPCFTTKIKFKQEALEAYQTSVLSLKVENAVTDESFVFPIAQKNGKFFWEKAIPVGESLTFTVLKNNEPLSYPYSKGTQTQLAKILAPIQLAQVESASNKMVRKTDAPVEKISIPVSIGSELVNKEVLIIIADDDGKLLWQQYYGKAERKLLDAQVPKDESYSTHIVPSNTVCTK